MSQANKLPEGFQELEGFLAYWSLDTNQQRHEARSSATMPDIQRFYDAIFARAEEAITFCEKFPLDAQPHEVEQLFKLLLAMNHAAIAVEMHGQPRAIDSVWPSAVRVSKGPWPYGGYNLIGDSV